MQRTRGRRCSSGFAETAGWSHWDPERADGLAYERHFPRPWVEIFASGMRFRMLWFPFAITCSMCKAPISATWPGWPVGTCRSNSQDDSWEQPRRSSCRLSGL